MMRPRNIPIWLRIWLAVLLSLLLTTLLIGLAWRAYYATTGFASETSRTVILNNAQGQAVGRAQIEIQKRDRGPPQVSAEVTLDNLPPGAKPPVLFAQIPMPSVGRTPFGFIGWLVAIVLAVGLGAYPVVRRLTRRLEQLTQGVDALGEGQLGARVAVRGHDEIATLAARFNHAAERIETLMRAQQSLLANASHELRSPLARIRMGLGLLDDSQCRNAVATAEIDRNITELDDLIEEILLASRLSASDAARVGSVPQSLDSIDLTALAAEECARGGVQLNSHLSVTLLGNERLLRRLLRNLIENARRYGSDDSAIEVSVLPDATHGDAIITVCDRGPGVPEAERERIFEPFYRLTGASEAHGGVGLGLALVRAIAQQHGGNAVCLPREGGGACFRVNLPPSK